MKVPPKIWVPKRDIIFAGDLRLKELYENIISFRAKAAGFFRIWKHSSRGTVLAAEFPNLLTNAFYDRVATAATLAFCQIGAGSTAPAPTDTNLVSYINNTGNAITTNSVYVAGTPDYIEYSRTFRFTAGTATGTIAEVGMSWTTGTGNLMSRALVLDSGGSPTTITVLSDETLDVEYRFRWYPPMSDVTGTLTLSGVPYNYTLRASFVNVSGWSAQSLATAGVGSGTVFSPTVFGTGSVLGSRTSQPSGGASSLLSATTVLASYTNGTFYRQLNLTVPLANGNVAGGIKAMTCGFNVGFYQILFDTIVPKDSTKVMTFSIRLGWGPH